ncbi:hypothetical protein BT69DRAFT_1348452 [Atractiella rhizophila]|nr:hypothetical protein BT69DRAFT_1348452 [Atractiella rhizophila]
MAAIDPTQIPDYIPYTDFLYRDTILPLTIGLYLALTLFGIGLLQFYNCFRLLQQSTEKETYNHVFLISFLILDLADTVVKCIYFSDNSRAAAVHGLAAAYMPSPKSVAALVAFGAFIPFVTHLFYIKRIYTVSRRWQYRYVVWAILVLCFLTGCVTLVFASLSARVGLRPAVDYFPAIKVLPVPWLMGEAVIDFLLCGTLVVYLYNQKTDFSVTNDLLHKQVTITVETGLFPATASLTDVVLGLCYPEKSYYFAANYIVTKAYINSVLVLFTNIQRGRVRQMLSEGSLGSRTGQRRPIDTYAKSLASGVMVKSQIDTLREPAIPDNSAQFVDLRRSPQETEAGTKGLGYETYEERHYKH